MKTIKTTASAVKDSAVQRYGLKEAQRRKQAGIDRLRELKAREL